MYDLTLDYLNNVRGTPTLHNNTLFVVMIEGDILR